MEGYIEEEQQGMIRGWEDTDQSQMYVKICVRGPLLSPQDPSLHKTETFNQKLPFKQHRRSSSKPITAPKHSDKNILRIDKQILNKYLTRQSEKNIFENPSENPKDVYHESKVPSQSKYDKKLISGVNIEMQETEDRRSRNNELFSGLKSEKKNRRKFYAKSKLLDEVIPNCLESKMHRKRATSKVASKPFDFQQKNQPFEIEEFESKKENKSKKSVSRKKRTFPIFFRELQIQQKQQQKKMYKRILQHNIRSRKNRTHFMLASSNPFENSIQFTDNNIFPPKYIRT